MTDTQTIPLNKLVPWDGNVRRTGATDGIDELAASIVTHGLLQSLVVRKKGKDRFEIVAGQRRYLALKSLVKKRKIKKEHPVPCTFANGDLDAKELSLAENVMRLPMHPADQFEAFREVIDGDAGIADVAARFSVSETLVAKRLKLGRLSPVVLQAYRDDEINLDQAQAFALSDDHEAQEWVLAELSSWNCNPHTIRRALTADEIADTDKRVQFIGLAAYEQAGGTVRRDLFGDDSYVQDIELLDRLVAERLSAIAGEISAEGWRWTECVPDLDYEYLRQFSHVYPKRVDLSEEDQAELDKLAGEYDERVDTDDDAEIERLAAIEERIDELSSKMESWPAETLATAGAIIALCHNGGVQVERGLLRKEDARKAKAEASSDADTAPAVSLSAKLVEDLTAQKSAAIGAELIRQPDIALASVVHTLALDTLYRTAGVDSCLELRINQPYLHGGLAQPESCKALSALDEQRDSWAERLPSNPAGLWEWCLDQKRGELLKLLAAIAAASVNTVQAKADRLDSARLQHGNVLAQALNVDMAKWFTPGEANYFSRINRASILASIDEAKGGHGPALDKMKKADLASRAEDMVADTGWLPEPLRISSDAEIADEPDVQADASAEALAKAEAAE